MTMDREGTVLSTAAPEYAASTWGPYYDVLYPQRQVHYMVQWRAVPNWIDHAVALWRQREELRRVYETEHGGAPERWPTRHPGVTLGDCAGCLGCQWIATAWRDSAELARRHEVSNGISN
ncbi:hypothetical protein [Mycobacterium sp. DBP42]|uniref:hypothetical protein n=1 Tax=Mycobacterium sp. DBP42 TaxID=2545267 RepID=UPI00110CE015|nr:hypothetical protein [Mycobacterium sp. DBP42]TMS54800.1 hypothetical protein E0T84_04360 [Mycobacterium sp. DBP42]